MADRKLMAVLESGSEWMSALNDQVKELRSRLRALEQNTVPASQAKEKPREWWLIQRQGTGTIHKTRTGDPVQIMNDCAEYQRIYGDPFVGIRVREVLDD